MVFADADAFAVIYFWYLRFRMPMRMQKSVRISAHAVAVPDIRNTSNDKPH